MNASEFRLNLIISFKTEKIRNVNLHDLWVTGQWHLKKINFIDIYKIKEVDKYFFHM